jgi:hypothetical protein
MPELYDKEAAEVDRVRDRVWYALGAGAASFAGGLIALFLAGPADVHHIGGGYAAIIIGVVLAALGVVLYHDARIMAREQRHYHCVYDRLGKTRESIALAVTDEMAEHRNGG